MKRKANVKILLCQIGLLTILGYIAYRWGQSPEYLQPLIVSLAATWILWRSSTRHLASFSGLTVVFCFIFYPGAALLNDILPSPKVHPLLWEAGVTGLWGYVVGALGLAAGFLFTRSFFKPNERTGTFGSSSNSLYEYLFGWGPSTTIAAFLIVTCCYGAGFLGRFWGGYYFYDYTDFEAANRWFFMDYFRIAAVAISSLMLEHASRSRSWLSICCFMLTVVELFVAFGLGGSRGLIVFPIFYMAVYAFSVSGGTKENLLSGWKGMMVMAAVGLLIIVMNSVWIRYRDLSFGEHDFRARMTELSSQVTQDNPFEWHKEGDVGLVDQMASRFQEFGYAGRIIEYFQDSSKDGFKDLERVPEFLLPSFLRWTKYYESAQGIEVAMEVNKSFEMGAPPITTIGDLFRRFGWSGIFIGMALMGVVLMGLDFFFAKPTLERRLHFLMFWFSILTTHLTMGIQGTLQAGIRPFFITWGAAIVLASGLKYFFEKQPTWAPENVNPSPQLDLKAIVA